MRIIIGLGNPGKKYEKTRHNAGWLAIDALADKLEEKWHEEKKLKAQTIHMPGLILAKPLTHMNNSGEAVKKILNYYKIMPKNLGIFTVAHSDLSDVLTVIHDDIDIDLGKYKISLNSRSAGHKGVESIIQNIKSKNFQRLRLGICSKRTTIVPTKTFVLERFNNEELKIIAKLIPQALKKIL